jgi:hypothetical protein
LNAAAREPGRELPAVERGHGAAHGRLAGVVIGELDEETSVQ